MKKKTENKILYILILFFVIIGGGLYYKYEVYPYDWDAAEKSFELYTKAQHIDKDDIESIEKSKQKEIGGIIYRVKYKSESNKNVVYEYTWCGDYTGENYYHNMFLMLTNKYGDGLDENKTKHKYPIIQKRIVD